MRAIAVTSLLAMTLLLSGCMISSQIGERTHVNSPPPEEITFHFDTSFNKMLLFGRSGLLLLIPVWVFACRGRGGDKILPTVLAVAAAVGAAWWFKTGWDKTHSYRIEVRKPFLSLQIPSEPDRTIPWETIEAIDVRGMASDVSFYDGPGQALKWSPEWEDLTIETTGGESFDVDLRPLSYEQRGTFWRAIKRKANLEGGVVYTPLSSAK